MFLALIFGVIAGIAMVIYQGIYMGPWDAVLHTMGMAVVGAVLIYIALHFIFSIGSFILKIVLILALLGALGFGGMRVWNAYMHDDAPIARFN